MPRLIILLVLIAIAIMAFNAYGRMSPEQRKAMLKKLLLWGGIGILVLLVLTGRIHWLIAVIGAAIPLLKKGFLMLRYLPLLRQLMATLGISMPLPGFAKPTMTTAFLRMTMEPGSGELAGTILQGSQSGRSLSDLEMPALIALFDEFRSDNRSCALLAAWLDQQYGPAWREQASAHARESHNATDISLDEAYSILGLENGATEEDIKLAHKRLIQKTHPDRGGSAWLAAQINQARDTLLNSSDEGTR